MIYYSKHQSYYMHCIYAEDIEQSIIDPVGESTATQHSKLVMIKIASFCIVRRNSIYDHIQFVLRRNEGHSKTHQTN